MAAKIKEEIERKIKREKEEEEDEEDEEEEFLVPRKRLRTDQMKGLHTI